MWGGTAPCDWLDHMAATAAWQPDAVVFEFSARDALEEVARGRHNRFVVGVDKTRQRLLGKLAKAQAA